MASPYSSMPWHVLLPLPGTLFSPLSTGVTPTHISKFSSSNTFFFKIPYLCPLHTHIHCTLRLSEIPFVILPTVKCLICAWHIVGCIHQIFVGCDHYGVISALNGAAQVFQGPSAENEECLSILLKSPAGQVQSPQPITDGVLFLNCRFASVGS